MFAEVRKLTVPLRRLLLVERLWTFGVAYVVLRDWR